MVLAQNVSNLSAGLGMCAFNGKGRLGDSGKEKKLSGGRAFSGRVKAQCKNSTENGVWRRREEGETGRADDEPQEIMTERYDNMKTRYQQNRE